MKWIDGDGTLSEAWPATQERTPQCAAVRCQACVMRVSLGALIVASPRWHPAWVRGCRGAHGDRAPRLAAPRFQSGPHRTCCATRPVRVVLPPETVPGRRVE